MAGGGRRDLRQHARRNHVLLGRPALSATAEWALCCLAAALRPAGAAASWVPVVGDGLCVAAGWLRQNAVAAAVFIAAGKLARYLALVAGWGWVRG